MKKSDNAFDVIPEREKSDQMIQKLAVRRIRIVYFKISA
jgi:hypothetical protein